MVFKLPPLHSIEYEHENTAATTTTTATTATATTATTTETTVTATTAEETEITNERLYFVQVVRSPF